MTVLRACLDCGAPSPWTRCALHRQARQRVRTRNRKTARAVVAAQPWCTYCGSTTDLTSDHVVPVSVSKDGRGPQVTACRRCNSSRADRARTWRGRGKG